MEEKKLKRKKERAIIEGNYDQLYHSCKELGDDYLRDEKNETALEEYTEAEKAARKLGNKLYIAVTNRMIGETLCAMGEFEEAIKHQKIHLQYARDEGNLIEEQRALATLGRTYFVQAESFTDLENNERARSLNLSHKYYLKSLGICEMLPLSNQLGQKTLAEMKSRLFLNLGLTSEAEGNSECGIEYISKAIVICKNMELWEDLCRCYTAQGSIHHRRGSTAKALTAYDKGLQAAEHVEKKVQLSCELLSLKADVLIMLCDYNGAKNVLIKAYKMKNPDRKERYEIEDKLKIVVLICKFEKRLMETSQSDYTSRKEINEKLGDLCVKLNNYDKAIQFYLSTLECASAMGLQGQDLSPIYYSLSQTYKDNKQYELSIEYSQKEFQLIKDSYADACQTLLNMTDTMELMKEPFDKLMDSYKECLSLAKKAADLKMEAAVLKNMLRVQTDYGRHDLAEETEQELNVVNCCLPDIEEDIEVSDIEVPEEDVDLDELSDICSNDDEDPLNQDTRQRRRMPRSAITRRNEKGETPLHVASAKGNVPLIRSLVKQGHPVNIPDAAGWSPLHEACNHGQIEAARVLIELGAKIDDRGGPSCDGITPLLDAASNGHLELMTLLLDQGASPLAKTNQGDTVLDCLLACRDRAIDQGEKLDYDTQVYFDSVVQKLKQCYDKVGQNYSTISKSILSEKQTQRSQRSQRLVGQTMRNESLSKVVNEGRKQTEIEVNESSTSVSGAKEYKDAIEALRRRNKNNTIYNEPLEKSKKSALLADEDVGDNWLEDDLEEMRRPAKRRCENFVGQPLRQTKKCSSTSNVSSEPVKQSSSMQWDDTDDSNDLFRDIDIPELIKDTRIPSPVLDFGRSSTTKQVERPKPKYQKSLLSMDFTRSHPPSSSTSESKPTSSPPIVQVVGSIQTIKVRIESKLFLVPIPQSKDPLTIGWLASEASRRYQNNEGVTPVLNLTTKEGALLDANDPISIILNDGEVCATVLSWNLKPLNERYKEVCSAANIDADSYLELRLDMCQASSSLEIKDRRLSIEVLTPVFKAIQHYQSLMEICLSSVFLLDQSFKIFVDHISKLNQLRSLNVSVNHITNDGLSYFVQIVSSGSLKTLEYFDISYNPLGDDSGQTLCNLSRELNYLRSLNLRCTGLTPKCFSGSWQFEFNFIENLDVSFNELSRDGIAKFLSALDPYRIRSLNVSYTGNNEVLREVILFLDRGHADNLEALFLTNLEVDDDDVQQFAETLLQAPRLQKLNLSNNQKITIKSHEYLSQLKSLKELHLSGCALLTEPHKLTLSLDRLTLSSDVPLSGFKNAPYCYLTNTTDLFYGN